MENEGKKTLVVNLFGGAGTGKSTLLYGLMWILKVFGMVVEAAIEFPKSLVWEKRYWTLKRQIYIFGKHTKILENLDGEVEIVVSEASPLVSLFYLDPKASYAEAYKNLILEYSKQYNNVNIFVNRGDLDFEMEGRTQGDRDVAEEQGQGFRRILDECGIEYYVVESKKGLLNSIKLIMQTVVIIRRHYKELTGSTQLDEKFIEAAEFIKQMELLLPEEE
ncbi:MAG: AAA family ATPase [Ignavibacteriales bacterium]